jgi:predicted transposase YdaD
MEEKPDQPYDNGFKRLLTIGTQDIVDWLFKGAISTGNRSKEFQSRTIDADEMHEVLFCDQEMLCHIEAQSGSDAEMDLRLLEYCMLASRYYKKPVKSWVIYLKEGGSHPESPLIWMTPDGEEILRFYHRSIVLAKMTSAELFDEGLLGILPFVPFTRDGRQHDVIEKVIALLLSASDIIRNELLALTKLFASLAFDKTDSVNQDWIVKRFAMHKDILRDTPVFQRILEEGREEERVNTERERANTERERANVQKEHQEHLRSLREMFLFLVNVRFPQLRIPAKIYAKAVLDVSELKEMTKKIGAAQTLEEAEHCLIGDSAALDDE